MLLYAAAMDADRMNLAEAGRTLSAALREAGRGLVERESLVDLLGLAAVAREHLLVIGPPGTAKTMTPL